VVIREARAEEAGALSALALRSKAHWGYSAAFMARCQPELTITSHKLRVWEIWVAEERGRVLGFYALGKPQTASGATRAVALEMLFVDPPAIGLGYGRALLEHAKATARGLGASLLLIESDPNAARFYRSAGATAVGSQPSGSVPGRSLPLFEITLA
jgi:GNAT superfamily N-acetyltransferase